MDEAFKVSQAARKVQENHRLKDKRNDMKKILVTTSMLAATAGAFGQGVVLFDNLSAASPYIQVSGYANTVSGPVYTVFGPAYALNDVGSNPRGLPWYVALLYANTPGGGISQSVMNQDVIAIYEPNAKNGSGQDGAGTFEDYANGVRVHVSTPNVGPATFEVVSWIGTATTWASALAGGATYVGYSPEFTMTAVATTGLPPPPPSSVNSAGAWNGLLNLTDIPEPSAIAIGGVGAVFLLLFRRRK